MFSTYHNNAFAGVRWREVKAEAPGVGLREAIASKSDIFHIDAVSWNKF